MKRRLFLLLAILLIMAAAAPVLGKSMARTKRCTATAARMELMCNLTIAPRRITTLTITTAPRGTRTHGPGKWGP